MMPREGRTLIVGRSGSGKSLTMNELMRPAPRLILFDPKDDVPRFIKHRTTGGLKAMHARIAASPSAFKVAYVPAPGVDPILALDRICGYAMKLQEPFKAGRSKARLVLGIEEASTAFPLHTSRKDAPNIWNVLERGRASGIDTIATTQMPNEIAKVFRGNTDRVIGLALAHPTQRKTLAELLGTHVTAVPRINLIRLISDDGEVTQERVTVPKR